MEISLTYLYYYFDRYKKEDEKRMRDGATGWHGSISASGRSLPGGARSLVGSHMSGLEADTIADTLTLPPNDQKEDAKDLTKIFDFTKIPSSAYKLPIADKKVLVSSCHRAGPKP